MKRFLLAGLLALMLSGCAASQSADAEFDITVSKDKFNPGVELWQTTPIKLISESLTSSRQLNVQFMCQAKKSRWFYFYISYDDNSWAFINSMKLLIDGDPIEIPCEDSPKRTVISGRHIAEYAFFNIPETVIKKIMTSKQIDVRFVGENRNIDISFSPDTRGKLKRFILTLPDNR